MWRWGGRYGQIAWVGDTLRFFSGQHSIRVLGTYRATRIRSLYSADPF